MAPGKTREQQKKRDKGKAVSPPEPCAYCKADDATLPCKGCGQGRYCDKHCFTSHWPYHRETCTWRKGRDERLGVGGGREGRRGLLTARGEAVFAVILAVVASAAAVWWAGSAAASSPLATALLGPLRASRNPIVLFMRHQPFRFLASCLSLVLLIGRLVIAVRMALGKTQIWSPNRGRAPAATGAAADA